MCDKLEIEGVDYELCDHCGLKEQCGHLFAVWGSQEREVYDYWCYECKRDEAYQCKHCGELFPLSSGYVAIPAGGQELVDYICYGCHIKEHSRNLDMFNMLQFIRDIWLDDFDVDHLNFGELEEVFELEQLLCLWTAYCLNHNLSPDTSSYDQDIMKVYSKLYEKYPTIFVWRPEDMDEDEKSMFDHFDHFMGRYLS